jgi:hypothetical protein
MFDHWQAALLAARAAKHEKKPPVVATGKKAAKESTQTELALARQLVRADRNFS